MKRWILYILLGLIVFFIWDNSMQNGGSSDGFSLLFAETFAPIVNKLGFHGNIWTLNRIVRKLAHLTEFTILGGVLYSILRRYITYGTVIKTIGLGMLIAGLDEFIQLFSPGRSSQISDILYYCYFNLFLIVFDNSRASYCLPCLWSGNLSI